MSGSIRLHPKHGLNPTITTCFWCGEDKNEIALLGAAYSREAPRHMLLNYDPCDGCKENMEKGIVLIEADTSPFGKNQQPMQRDSVHGDIYPSGRWCVISEEATMRMLPEGPHRDSVIKHRKAFIEPTVADRIFGAPTKGAE